MDQKVTEQNNKATSEQLTAEAAVIEMQTIAPVFPQANCEQGGDLERASLVGSQPLIYPDANSQILSQNTQKSLSKLDPDQAQSDDNDSEDDETTLEEKFTQNSLESVSLCQNVQDYVRKVSHNLNLTRLYTVVDICLYNDQSELCPVLLKLGEDMQEHKYSCYKKDSSANLDAARLNPDRPILLNDKQPLSAIQKLSAFMPKGAAGLTSPIKQSSSQANPTSPTSPQSQEKRQFQESQKEKSQGSYLLQVWLKGGHLIFERLLPAPVVSWNVVGNKFFWQESQKAKSVFTLVYSHQNDHSKIFNFRLPFECPAGSPFNQMPGCEFHAKRVHRGLSFYNDHLVIHSLMDVFSAFIGTSLMREVDMEGVSLERVIEVPFEAVKRIDCAQKDRMQPIGLVEQQSTGGKNDGPVLVYSDNTDLSISFWQFLPIMRRSTTGRKSQKDKKDLQIEQIHGNTTFNDLDSPREPILDILSLVVQLKGPEKEQLQIFIVQRIDFTVDIYTDFVHQAHLNNPAMQIKEVQFTFESLIFQCIEIELDPKKRRGNRIGLFQKGTQKTYECSLSFRDQICIENSRERTKTEVQPFEVVMKDYFNLYHTFLQFGGKYLLVAHRNYISYAVLSAKSELKFKTLKAYHTLVQHMTIIDNELDPLSPSNKDTLTHQSVMVIHSDQTYSIVRHSPTTENKHNFLYQLQDDKQMLRIFSLPGAIAHFQPSSSLSNPRPLFVFDNGIFVSNLQVDRFTMVQAMIKPTEIERAMTRKFIGSLSGQTRKTNLRCRTELRTFTKGRWVTILTNEKEELVGKNFFDCKAQVVCDQAYADKTGFRLIVSNMWTHESRIFKVHWLKEEQEELANTNQSLAAVQGGGSSKVFKETFNTVADMRYGGLNDVELTHRFKLPQSEVPRPQTKLIAYFSTLLPPSKESNFKPAQWHLFLFSDKLLIYDSRLILRTTITGLPIKKAFQVENGYLYAVCRQNTNGKKPDLKFIQQRPVREVTEDEDPIDPYDMVYEEVQTNQVECCLDTAGVYMFELKPIITAGKVVKVKILQTMDTLTDISCSLNNQKLTVIKDLYSSFVVTPLVHKNSLCFDDMEPMENYLIWHEEHGHFSALSKSGDLKTWSLATGKLLQKKKVQLDLSNYQIYQVHDNDQTYTRNFFSFGTKTLQLVVQRTMSEITHEQQQAQDLQSPHNGDNPFQNSSNLDDTKQLPDRPITPSVDFADDTSRQLLSKSQQQPLDQIQSNFQRYETREFKVLELLHSGPNNFNIKAEVREVCTFDDRCLRKIMISKNVQNPPIIYISSDTTLVMAVFEKRTAIVYNVGGKGAGTEGEKVSLQELKRVKPFPSLLFQQVQFGGNMLFSPNFSRYIDIDYNKKCFVIRNTFYPDVAPKVIPSSLLPLPEDIEIVSGQQKVLEMIKRVWFISATTLRFITASGQDILMCTETCQILSCAKITNFECVNFQGSHYFKHFGLERGAFLQRLIHQTQKIMTDMQHDKYLYKEKGAVDKRALMKSYLFDKMFTLDYPQRTKNSEQAYFQIQLPFIIHDWMILESRVINEHIDCENFSQEQLQRLCFHVFPQQKTIMHKLTQYSAHNADSNDLIIKNMDKLFELCSDNTPKNYEIPVIQDIFGMTFVDEALGSGHEYSKDSFFLTSRDLRYTYSQINATRPQSLIKNSNLVTLMLNYLKDYEYLHGGPSISKAVIQCIKSDIPCIGEFLQSRLVRADNLHHLTTKCSMQKNILQVYKNESNSKTTTYGMITANMNKTSKQNLEEQLFNTKKQNQDVQLMQVRTFDITGLHDWNKTGYDFLQALGWSQTNKDLKLYDLLSVQAIVNYQWKSHQKALFIALWFPYILLVLSYSYWCFFYVNTEGRSFIQNLLSQPVFDLQKIVFQYLILTLASYFLLIEIIQVCAGNCYEKSRYLLRVLPMLLIITEIVLIQFLNDKFELKFDEAAYRCQAFATLLLWVSSLTFLRGNQSIASLMQMLHLVTSRIGGWIYLWAITMLGSALAFDHLMQFKKAESGSKYTIADTAKFSFLLALGEFEDGFYENQADWAVWLLIFTIGLINSLIFMNLLIAIVCQVIYNDARHKDQEKYAYHQRVKLMSEIRYICCHMCFARCCRRGSAEEHQKKMLLVCFEDSQTPDFLQSGTSRNLMSSMSKSFASRLAKSKAISSLKSSIGKNMKESSSAQSSQNAEQADSQANDSSQGSVSSKLQGQIMSSLVQQTTEVMQKQDKLQKAFDRLIRDHLTPIEESLGSISTAALIEVKSTKVSNTDLKRKILSLEENTAVREQAKLEIQVQELQKKLDQAWDAKEYYKVKHKTGQKHMEDMQHKIQFMVNTNNKIGNPFEELGVASPKQTKQQKE